MKNWIKIYLLALIVISAFFAQAQVAVSTDGSSADASAMLDVKSTNKGLLVPRLTMTQRDGIVSPATGLIIYQTDNTVGFYYFNGLDWKPIGETPSLGIDDLYDGKRKNSGFFLGIDAGKNITSYYNISLGDYSLSEGEGGMDNVAIGYSALKFNSNGNSNTALGSQTLEKNINGEYNLASGAQALHNNISGNYNTAIGSVSLSSNTTASYNTSIGYSSLSTNTAGEFNTANGSYSLRYNTIGNNNSATGAYSLRDNIEGNNNSAFGYCALFKNKNNNNTAVGFYSLYSNIGGTSNTAIGFEAMKSNSSGQNNTSIGTQALLQNTTGNENSAIGYHALYSNTSGQNNIALGRYALNYNISGSYNVAVGRNAGSDIGATTLNNCVFIGDYAQGNQNNLTNAIAIGNNAIVTANNRVRIGDNNITRIGGEVSWSTLSDGRVKENIDEKIIGIDFIMKLRPINYTINKEIEMKILGINKYDNTNSIEMENQQLYSGFIAQEVEAVAQELGFKFNGVCQPENEKDLYSIKYADFVVPIIKAMQEQQQQIEELKKSNNELLKRINSLQARTTIERK